MFYSLQLYEVSNPNSCNFAGRYPHIIFTMIVMNFIVIVSIKTMHILFTMIIRGGKEEGVQETTLTHSNQERRELSLVG